MTSEHSKPGDDFEKLVIWVTTFSMAAAAGLMASIKHVNPVIEFRFSAVAAVAVVGVGLLTFLFSRMILRGHSSAKRKLLVLVVAALLTLPTYVLFALRSVSSDKRSDFAIGAGTAVVVLTFVGWLGWRVARFLEADEKQNRID